MRLTWSDFVLKVLTVTKWHFIEMDDSRKVWTSPICDSASQVDLLKSTKGKGFEQVVYGMMY